ncbi:unnamed protein product [Prorocentrum cordatum]|uniref:Protein-S-isoprenylcysteine O-methyltransferase n=1 Tax=Prorocentrum cordatum TaxID=2364126 RepID=A0ABN9QDJ3_9DINO|nr:unnamed protein product [Polarella glacialis]|mmetsp:Transcript_49903/g.129518  ORF Transcript_49903/g.129518 Transcript_49903/m.129518 type:complete len:187 (+) Transcript_49903:120-680(+)
MLFPFPTMPEQIGPPSRFTVRMTRPVIAVLLLQSICCIMRFGLLLDILGGFVMLICVGFGWYAWWQEMNITYICYWGMMCLIRGIFDVVKLIDHEVHSRHPFFSSHMPTAVIAQQAIYYATPLTMLLGALLAYLIYVRRDDNTEAYNSGRSDWSYGAAEEGSWATRPSANCSFQQFGGTGRRLGTS